MYSVSNEFKDAMLSPAQEHRLTGTIGNISFDESNIVEGSFQITNQSTDTNDVVLGSCYVGQLTAEFVGINIAYGKWINKTITLSFGLKVGEYYEYVPLGVYKIKEAKHTDHGVQVTAYDNMIKFDKKFVKTHFMNLSGMTNIIDQLCLDAGVVCGMSHAQIEALPNGDRTGINIYGSTGKKAEFANDITTLRDLLFWVAQTLGCFATINRAGQLEFRQYNQNVVDQITEQHRIAGATFADYITHYVGIYVENLDDNTEDYYGYDTTALTQELQETMSEITEDQEDITDLENDRADWVQKLANHECTQQEYDAAIAEIDAQEKALTKEINQLSKRAEWLSNAISMSADDGSDMVLGANPLVMAKNLTTRDQQRREILGALNAISYTPFQASVVCGCIYDLGDVIQFSGGLYNSDIDSFGCVMSYTYTHNGGTELEGFGVDPSVVVVRNKTQKSVDRADRNAHESTRTIVGEGNPNPDDPDNPVTGKEGDLYIQENHPTKKLQITKTFKGFQTYHICVNNLTYYTLDTFHLSCNSGNFVTVFIPGVVHSGGRDYKFCVINSKSMKFGDVYFVLKLPKNATLPEFEASVNDVEEYNFPPPSPFSTTHLHGWGNPDENVNKFEFHGNADSWRQLNDAGTHYYYFGSIYGSGGTWIGGMLDEPTYTFENMTAFRNAMKADEIVIPDVYEGQESKQIKYNDGSGGSSQWKGISTVSNVSTSEEAGGTENNGLALSQSILSLKPNVVRAWYKADPPQTKRTFSQLCVRYTGSPDKQVVIEPYANHEWANSSVEKDDDGVYKIKCHGEYNSENRCYVTYRLTGLVQEKTYYFNFRCKFSNNAAFNYDMSKGCGLIITTESTVNTDNWAGDEDTYYPNIGYYAFKRNTNPWYGDFGFEALSTTMYMHVLMQCETTAADVTFTLSEFVCSQKERELIRNIYLYDYHVNEWLKYKPFTGTVSGGDEGGSTVAIQPTVSQGTKIANFSIDGIPGELYAPDNEYELPIASEETLGGIKVGQNLSIDEDGTLSANAAPSTVEDLTDVEVDIQTLADGQVLKWDSVEEKWVNEDESGGSQAIELTKAQYDALPSADKNDPNKVYYVTDYPTPTGAVGKNILPMTLSGIKAANPHLTWTDETSFTSGNVTVTFQVDGGDIYGIHIVSTGSNGEFFNLCFEGVDYSRFDGCILSGCDVNDENKIYIAIRKYGGANYFAKNISGDTIINYAIGQKASIFVYLSSGSVDTVLKPMIRKSDADNTYEPPKPSNELLMDLIAYLYTQI